MGGEKQGQLSLRGGGGGGEGKVQCSLPPPHLKSVANTGDKFYLKTVS